MAKQDKRITKPVYVRAALDLLDQLGVETDNADDTEEDD